MNRNNYGKFVFAWLLAMALMFAPPIKLVAHVSGVAQTFAAATSAPDSGHGHRHHDIDDDSGSKALSHDMTDHSHDFGMRVMPIQTTGIFSTRGWWNPILEQRTPNRIFQLDRPPKT